MKLMVVMRTNSMADRIQLFIKIADSDGNGLLTFEEVYNLCKLSLSKFLRYDREGGVLD